jgi:molybdopterin-containing oxidoreductase family membrane subunit
MSAARKTVAFIAVLGLAAGAYGVFEALAYGTHATGLGSYTPWGIGVAFYLLFLGFSAGGLLLTLLIEVFGYKQFKPLVGVAVWQVLVSEVCAGIAIILDLGHWERIWRFIISPSPTSPMFWMLVFFNGVLLVYALKAYAIWRKDVGLEKAMTWLSIPVSLLFYGTNGYFFSILSSHPAWFGGLTPALFVIAALFSNGALLTVLARSQRADDKLVLGLGRVMLILLVLFWVLELLRLFVGLHASDEARAAFRLMLFGPDAWVYWLGGIVLCGLAPLVLLAAGWRSPAAATLAGLSIIAGFLAVRYAFLLPPQGVPMLPGLDQAFIDPRLSLTYTPLLGEWLVGVFVASLSLLAFALGPQLLPWLFIPEGGRHV